MLGMNGLSQYDNGPVENGTAWSLLFVAAVFLGAIATAIKEPAWREPLLWAIGIGAFALAGLVILVLIARGRGDRNSRRHRREVCG